MNKIFLIFLILIYFLQACKEDKPPIDFALEKTSINDISVIIEENEKKEERKKQLDKIRIFPEKEMMEATGVSLAKIKSVLESETHTSGPLTGRGTIQIQSVFSNIEELQYLIVKGEKESIVYLGDIADIFSGVTDEEALERGKQSGYFEFILTDKGYVLNRE